MSSLEAVIADVKALVETISGAGVVYNVDRRGVAPGTIESSFGVADVTYPKGYRVNFTTIDRQTTQRQLRTQNDLLHKHVLLLCIYTQLQDPGSKATHRATVEAICDLLEQTVETDEIQTLYPPNVIRDTDGNTGGLIRLTETVTCHYTVITVEADAVQER